MRRLARQPGQREERWAHLLSGEPTDPPPDAARPAPRSGGSERLSAIEAELGSLRQELDATRRDLAELRELLS